VESLAAAGFKVPHLQSPRFRGWNTIERIRAACERTESNSSLLPVVYSGSMWPTAMRSARSCSSASNRRRLLPQRTQIAALWAIAAAPLAGAQRCPARCANRIGLTNWARCWLAAPRAPIRPMRRTRIPALASASAGFGAGALRRAASRRELWARPDHSAASHQPSASRSRYCRNSSAAGVRRR